MKSPRKFFPRLVLAVFLSSLLVAHTVLAADFPRPRGLVNDFANILTAEEENALEQTLAAFEKATSNEFVVAIVSSFEGFDRFTYSQELFTKWGIGKKDKNNGILFLMGPAEGLPFPERGQIFVNVGKGLEGALPDSMVGSILRAEVYPEFKAKNYASGIERGVAAIIRATKGEYTAPTTTSSNNSSGRDFGNVIFFAVWLGFIFLSWMASFLGRTKSWWAGGVIGGALGAALGAIFWTGAMIFISGTLLAGLGFLFDFIVSKNYAYRKAHGLPTDIRRSGGGFWFWGGGGRGGFGGGGGGFGGFGGGGSGGGGAGGSW